jgi:glutaminase
VNPELFSICVVTVDGEVYQVGDDKQLFTIESISKVFAYGLALFGAWTGLCFNSSLGWNPQKMHLMQLF